ncbi:MAG: glycosyltransferase [Planctomycetes bacterium]|nr:glycosyltransferase [Planctomycetota bacterium]
MKIGLVNGNTTWGGGERWFADAARALEDRGHDVLVFTPPAGELGRRLTARAIPVVEFVREHLASRDVVLCNTGKDVRRARRTARSREPRLVMRRGIDRPLVDNVFRRRVWKDLTAILVNSEATRETVKRSLPWFPEDRIQRIYNPVTLYGDDPLPIENVGGPLRIGCVGRLVPQKGLDVLLEALTLLPRELAWRCEIAGEGKLRPTLERALLERGLVGRLHLLGHVDDLGAYYAHRDLVVMPSRYEGFGFVAIEAALRGLPVIASDVSSLRELVEHDVTGLLCPVGDAALFSDAIQRLARDLPLRRHLGERARQRALSRFAPEPIHDALARFLAEASTQDPVGSRA